MICEICGKKLKFINAKHLIKHGLTVAEYKEKYNLKNTIDASIGEKISKTNKGKINIGDNNAAKRDEVKIKISNTVKKRWKQGRYDDRINGMLNIKGEKHPNFKPEIREPCYFAEKNYIEFLSKFQDISFCSRCNSLKKKINIHHIDENHENFLPSNLEPLCVPCHSSFHYSHSKLPYISITKIFSFASAHWLPDYDGLCKNPHGHEWKLEVEIRKRVDKKTGMVLDFKELKKIVTENIIDILDHDIINKQIENPTAENIMVWIWERLMFNGLLKGINSIKLWESETSFSYIDINGMLSVFKTKIEEYLK